MNLSLVISETKIVRLGERPEPLSPDAGVM